MIRLFWALTVTILLTLAGCASGGKLASGEKCYHLGEYHKAASHFKKAYSHEKNRFYKARASYLLGRCYLKLNQSKRAASSLDRAIRNGFSEPEVYLYWGEALQSSGAFEDAIEAYQKFLEYEVGNVLANNAIASCRMMLKNPQETRYVVEEAKDLNSRYCDFSPAFEGDDFSRLYFSSMRKSGKRKKNTSRITGQGNTVVYFSQEKGDGRWEEPKPFADEASMRQEDGTPSLTGDGKELYFTRCPYLEDGPSGAAIWMMKKMGGRWGEPEKMEMGPDSLIFAHPAVSADGDRLFFVSDMPGGLGGLDIWQITRKADGSWGVPMNPGPEINTPGDEMFPYVRNDGRLYFASNGRIGFGGLDLFEATLEDETWVVKNMGSPMNSAADDFGIAFRGDRESGFFSSSRNSSKGIDNIYAFQRPLIVPTLAGKVLDVKGNPVKEAVLRLVGNDGTNINISPQEDGSYQMVLATDVNYVIMASAPDYLNHKEHVSTLGLSDSKVFERNLVLESARTAILFYDILYDAQEVEVNAQAKENLDRVARILTTNPNFQIKVEVSALSQKSETDDLVVAQKRAQAVERYLVQKGVAKDQLKMEALGRFMSFKVDEALARKLSFLSVGQELSAKYIFSLSASQQKRVLKEVNRVHFSFLE